MLISYAYNISLFPPFVKGFLKKSCEFFVNLRMMAEKVLTREGEGGEGISSFFSRGSSDERDTCRFFWSFARVRYRIGGSLARFGIKNVIFFARSSHL